MFYTDSVQAVIGQRETFPFNEFTITQFYGGISL